jgi:hypothetical protein
VLLVVLLVLLARALAQVPLWLQKGLLVLLLCCMLVALPAAGALQQLP